MFKRCLILTMLIFLSCGQTPAFPGVQEVSDQLPSGSIENSGTQNSAGSKNLSGDELYVHDLYKTILNREPDADGFNQWVNALRSGRLTRDQVKKGFTNSIELFVRNLYKELLNREPDQDGFNNWISRLRSGQMSRSQVRQAFINSPEYRSTHGNTSAQTPATPTGENTGSAPATPAVVDPNASGDLYGYNRALYGPVWDMVMKFVQANQAYVYAAGHSNQAGIATKTDCSGFVGSVYHKLAEASGIPATKDYGNANSYSTSGTQKVTGQYPPPNPRDLIKPGDVMVTSGGGHIVMFMGYDRSGNPLIAHSTPGAIDANDLAGNVGRSGVRIEVMPNYMRTNVSDRYPGQTPFKGVFRINGMDEMLNKLAGK